MAWTADRMYERNAIVRMWRLAHLNTWQIAQKLDKTEPEIERVINAFVDWRYRQGKAA